MRPVLVLLAAVAFAAACSGKASKVGPTVTVTATAPKAAATLSATDHATARVACFGWTTYQQDRQAGESGDQAAIAAQRFTVNMSDPRWSRVADLPPDEAMRVLGGLCAEIHYRERP